MKNYLILMLLGSHILFSMEDEKIVREFSFKHAPKQINLSSTYEMLNGDIIQPQFDPFKGSIGWISKSSKIETYMVNKIPYKNVEFLKIAHVDQAWLTVFICQDKKPNDKLCFVLKKEGQIDQATHAIRSSASTFHDVALFSVIGDLTYDEGNAKDCQLIVLKTLEKYANSEKKRLVEEEYLIQIDERGKILGEIIEGKLKPIND